MRGYAWLDVISLNVLHEHVRHFRDRLTYEFSGNAKKPSANESIEDPLEQLADSGGFEHIRVQEILELVSPEERAILHCRYVLELSPDEIAVQNGWKLGATYMRLSRAREQLRKALKGIS